MTDEIEFGEIHPYEISEQQAKLISLAFRLMTERDARAISRVVKWTEDDDGDR